MLQTRQNDLAPGTRIETFEIVRTVGAGGFGITYEATDTELGRPVAVKEYCPQGVAERTREGLALAPISHGQEEAYAYGLRRFLDEARVLAQFQSPYIVRVVRYMEANGTAYLVMEYEPGPSLTQFVRQHGTLESSAARQLLTALLRGLAVVHGKNYLHRDIKPGNIVIRDDGSPVLLDFGAARSSLAGQDASMTVMFTPGYAPFEQYTTSQTLGPWSDIYAAGATIYFALAGRPPVQATDRISVVGAGSPDPLETALDVFAESHDDDLIETLVWMLKAQPYDRPQDVSSLLARLEPPTTQTVAPVTRTDVASPRPTVTEEPRTVETGSPETGVVDSQPTSEARSPASVATSGPPRASKTPALAAAAAIVAAAGVWYFTSTPSQPARPAAGAATTAPGLPAPTPATVAAPAAQTTAPTPAVTAKATTAPPTATASDSETGAAPSSASPATALADDGLLRDQLAGGGDGPVLVNVPAGSFEIGSPSTEAGRDDDESPRKTVRIAAGYAIGQFEVTRTEFAAFAEQAGYLTTAERDPANGCQVDDDGWTWQPGTNWRSPGFPQTDNDPVVCVSWEDAVAYVRWLSAETRQRYTLPSEAVWEYVTRAGSASARFWRTGEACAHANVSDLTRAQMHDLESTDENIFLCSDGFAYTAPVGSFNPNAFAVHDTLGNVWEWTGDCWQPDYSALGADGAAHVQPECKAMTFRGGSWINTPRYVRSASRAADRRSGRYFNVGFRVMRHPVASTAAIPSVPAPQAGVQLAGR